MNANEKPRLAGDTATGFLRQKVVRSMDGVLFALLSALLTFAGASAFFEDSGWTTAVVEAAASASIVPGAVAANEAPAVVADAHSVQKR